VSTATLELARVEATRLARNPLVWVSIVPTAFWVRSARTAGEAEGQMFLLIGFGLLIPCLTMMMMMVLSVLRGRLEHTEELLGSLAVGHDRRSIGHAMSAVGGGLVAIMVTIGFLVALPFDDPLGRWSPYLAEEITVPRPNVAQILQGPLAVIAMLVFVVALVRWVPSWLVMLPITFLLLMVQGLWVGIWHGTRTEGTRWVWPLNSGVVNGKWVGCAPESALCDLPVSGFDTTTPWWHAAYLLALCPLFGSIAVLRHRRDRITWVWFAGACALVAALVVVQIVVAKEYTGGRLT
jgi:hypothetical protein